MNLPFVTIGCPIRNRAWIFKDYWNALLSLDYPKELIDIRFVLNDSTDATKDMLLETADRYASLYHSFQIMEMNLHSIADTRTYKSRIALFPALAKLRNYWLSLSPEDNWAFSIDSDIFVEHDILDKLLAHNKDICSCFISNEFIPKPIEQSRGNIMRWANAKHDTVVHIKPVPLNQLIKVDVTGAVYLLSPDVVKNVRYENHRQGEDIGFCKNAQDKGFELYCDTSQILKHVMDSVRYSKTALSLGS